MPLGNGHSAPYREGGGEGARHRASRKAPAGRTATRPGGPHLSATLPAPAPHPLPSRVVPSASQVPVASSASGPTIGYWARSRWHSSVVEGISPW
ncbi:hypothetical protein KCH_42510 [Kitasatospora cheerisanensis KCTC 2395]|uniref:Uncharacterized protein n=1 Tax=Kitasatospora cheerisanensis KCTC 2395 TaxID=1348663 RepID=A0A066Z2Q4_9ACTN|nr:hypothetical protein KCH_42510 [Kitasatospora cheerisanensis KCTC 2395]